MRQNMLDEALPVKRPGFPVPGNHYSIAALASELRRPYFQFQGLRANSNVE
ncbi:MULTISPECIES: GCN5 family acetyltransferase [unclassified Brucella]|uniref:GCN5 family acetyltransferase n=1 Tax=unclassified Brucella TaxID=2632610 RepID=UPI000972B93C|nr:MULTISPECIES: GCN5 family acetyltransferase [unclassified Brucella]APX70352.1 GCN5 family acetyltransferase [Brucella sp. 09RB8471]MRN79547.1 GCN5 family acetyltransferase [Brucella sp. 10RB9210]